MKQPKIPTLLAIILLVIGIAAGVFLIQSDKIFTTNASPEITPSQIRITNITDRGFAVSWVTDKNTQGYLSFGNSQSLGQTANQQANTPNAQTTVHHVLVDGLAANSMYYFKIGSATQLFDNNGQLYQVKTAPKITNVPTQDIIFGTLLDSSDQPISGAVVYISLLGVTPISIMTDTSGKWSYPLSTARSTNLNSYSTYSPDSIIELFVQGGTNHVSTAKIKTKDAHPVPNIILGQNQDFTNIQSLQNGNVPSSQINLPSNQTQAQPSTSQTATSQIQVTLTSPLDQEVLSNNKPVFSGTGTPKTKINLKLESTTTYTGAVTIKTDGTWTWVSPAKLAAGSHTLTLSWKDENNLTKSLVSTFTIAAQTASSAITTSQAIATPLPTSLPTNNPSPASTSLAQTKVGLPANTTTLTPGSLTPSISIFIMGMLLIFAGIFLPKFRF